MAQTFNWQVIPTGNNTSTPSSNIALLYSTGSATPAATGFSIAANGKVNWAAGQTFPGTGTGTITGITTTSPLTGSGTSGSVALGLNQSTLVTNITPSMATALEPTYNGLYAQLAVDNTFTAPLQEPLLIRNLSLTELRAPIMLPLYGFGSSGTVGTFGNSDTYYGIWGRTDSPANGVSSVLGSSSSFSNTYTGLGNTFANEVAGVWGDTTGNPNSTGGGTSGIYWAAGVLGTADNANAGAFYNNSTNYFTVSALALGSSGAIGGDATSGVGVFGQSRLGSGVGGHIRTKAGASVSGESATADGVDGESSSGIGVSGITLYNGTFGTDLDGVSGLTQSPAPGNAGVFGDTYTTSGRYGFLTSDNFVSGVWADSADVNDTTSNSTAGLIASADDSAAAIIVNNSASSQTLDVREFQFRRNRSLYNFSRLPTLSGSCGIGGGTLTCTGQMKTLATTGGGAHTVETYAPQSAENWMEDYGTGTMKMGVAVVKIDPAFADTVSETADYHVFLTPNADSRGLYVINKTLTSFEVRESGGGTSSLTFDYKIVGKRRGFEAQRLVDVTERFNKEQARTMIARVSTAIPSQQQACGNRTLRLRPTVRGATEWGRTGFARRQRL